MISDKKAWATSHHRYWCPWKELGESWRAPYRIAGALGYSDFARSIVSSLSIFSAGAVTFLFRDSQVTDKDEQAQAHSCLAPRRALCPTTVIASSVLSSSAPELLNLEKDLLDLTYCPGTILVLF